MAVILLTDTEYQHIQNLQEDLLNRLATATPRAATHYNAIVKLCADFLAKEDGKRQVKKTREATRDRLEKQNEARRAANGTKAQAPQDASTGGKAQKSA